MNAENYSYQDNFGGAVPLASLPLPSPFTRKNGNFFFYILTLATNFSIGEGKVGQNLQEQINVVDSLTAQRGSHSLKFGLDFRRLTPVFNAPNYSQQIFFNDIPTAETGQNTAFVFVLAERRATLLFRNLGAFSQDTWRSTPRLTLTYGLRWDVDFAPSSLSGPNFVALTGFDLANLSQLALAPVGTPPFKTSYGSIAPRLGLAYQIRQKQDWQTVLRGGFGVFYDLTTSEAGNAIYHGTYPFGSGNFIFSGVSFPLSSSNAAPVPVTPAVLQSGGLFGFDPNLKPPYTLKWNLALEQSVGNQQMVSASYIGSVGRRLLQTAIQTVVNPNFGFADLVTNAGTSDYHALQLQFQRRLSHGLQALASYTLAHSIDTGSAGSIGNLANVLVPAAVNANRGPSDFDIRNAFSAGVTYYIPSPKSGAFTRAVVAGWSLHNTIQARSAPPVDVSDANFFRLNSGFGADIRPDLVPGQSVYLFGSQYAGGKAFNPVAFTNPPVDPNTGNPVRNGDMPRNFLRGFGATQWDFAVHRDFRILESLKLQFRAEMFNVLNHPNFGPPSSSFGIPGFGVSTQTLNQSSSSSFNQGVGGFSALYQMGGPRSIQLALKLHF